MQLCHFWKFPEPGSTHVLSSPILETLSLTQQSWLLWPAPSPACLVLNQPLLSIVHVFLSGTLGAEDP